MPDKPYSELHLTEPIPAFLEDGIWKFRSYVGASGKKMARSVVVWLEKHPDVTVRAIVPVMEAGQVDEMWLIPA